MLLDSPTKFGSVTAVVGELGLDLVESWCSQNNGTACTYARTSAGSILRQAFCAPDWQPWSKVAVD